MLVALLLALGLVLLFSVINGSIIIGTGLLLGVPKMNKRKIILIAGAGSILLTGIGFYALVLLPMGQYGSTIPDPQFGGPQVLSSTLITGLAWAHIVLGMAATVYALVRAFPWFRSRQLVGGLMAAFLFAHIVAILFFAVVLIQ